MTSILLFTFLLFRAPIAFAHGDVVSWKVNGDDQIRMERYVESGGAGKFSCLPKDVRLSEIVGYDRNLKESVTLEKALQRIGAKCRKGKLVDGKRREIAFLRIVCWGHPPPNYLEIERQENERLKELKRRYTVIVFGCNPTISRNHLEFVGEDQGAMNTHLLTMKNFSSHNLGAS